MCLRNNVVLLLFAFTVLFCVNLSATCKNATCSNYIGVLAPLFTPFTNNTCKVNEESVCKDLQYYKAVDGFILTSKIGEGYSMSENECKTVYKICTEKIRAMNKSAKIYILIGDNTQTGKNLARYAEKLKVSGIFVLPPLYYNRRILTSQSVVNDMKELAACAPKTPLFFSLDPDATVGLQLNIYEIFTQSVKQVHTFSGMVVCMEQAMQLRASGVVGDKALIIRTHYAIHAAALFNFNGITTLAINLDPELAASIWHAKNFERACKKQNKMNKVVASLARPFVYQSSCKAAYEMVTGIPQGGVRTPLRQVSCEQRKDISAKLLALGYKLKSPVTSCNDEEEQCLNC